MSEEIKTEPVSQEFERAFVSGGGCSIVRACGRTHYDWANNYDWEEGHLEALKKDPEAIGHEYCVEFMHIEGAPFVAECPCNGAKKYENWIVAHAARIARFLNARAAHLLKEAEAARLHETLSESVITVVPNDPFRNTP